jgi:nucleoside-diphosphate-sugar epimerase
MATKAPLPQKILLFGATGVIGKYILQALLESNANFPKIGIFTSAGSEQKNQDNFDALKRKGIDLIVGDVHNEEDVKDALWNKGTLHLPAINKARPALQSQQLRANIAKSESRNLMEI